MTIVDSCGWLEYFLEGPLTDAFEGYLEAPGLAVPTVVLFEVYKVVKRDASQRMADRAVVQMRTHPRLPLTDEIALLAADLCLEHRLSLADSLVLATAQLHDATLVTSDFHFAEMPGVEYLAPRGD